jgi:hypothetical protein
MSKYYDPAAVYVENELFGNPEALDIVYTPAPVLTPRGRL